MFSEIVCYNKATVEEKAYGDGMQTLDQKKKKIKERTEIL